MNFLRRFFQPRELRVLQQLAAYDDQFIDEIAEYTDMWSYWVAVCVGNLIAMHFVKAVGPTVMAGIPRRYVITDSGRAYLKRVAPTIPPEPIKT